MKIDVTAKNIAGGVRSYPSLCPIALALYERTGENWHVSSDEATLPDNSSIIVPLPQSARAFIAAFDAPRSQVAPFSFEFNYAGETK